MGKMVSLGQGVFLATVLVFSLIFSQSALGVGDVSAKSIAFEQTTIIEFTNDGDVPVNVFRMWLGESDDFKSFKTESGWTGTKTPQGVIIFSSNEPMLPGESIKFGVKTDKAKPGINWRALDNNENEIKVGKTLADDLPQVITTEKKTTILDSANFRIIPEKPNVGSTIRVTGGSFESNHRYDFFLNTQKLGSFTTDSNGNFLTTVKIPDTASDRVDFSVRDGQGNEKKISIRLGTLENRVVDTQDIRLAISGLPDKVFRGEELFISGTANPGSTITARIMDPDGNLVETTPVKSDSRGRWEVVTIVPLEAKLGEYSATITDGRDTFDKSWIVETSQVLNIVPYKVKYEPGELFAFNGTGLSNEPLEVILEDPLGNELFSNIIQVGDTGFVEFTYQTSQTSIQGTYTVIAKQSDHIEYTYVGIGQLPEIPVRVEFNKLNYKSNEKPVVILTGKALESVNLLILDPSDKPKGAPIPIKLGPDGKSEYTLDITGYSTGVYAAVVSKGNTKSSTTFAVGLLTGSGDITINTTKISYNAGEAVLVLGETGPNVLLTLSLIDPDNNVVKTRESFSNKNGRISEDAFRIPIDAKAGIWKINAKSGANFDNVEFEVSAVAQEGLTVMVEGIEKRAGLGDFVNIRVLGAKSTVEIDIVTFDGIVIGHTEFPPSQSGEVRQPWQLPKDTPSGTYTVKAKDAFDTAETTFEFT